jgi:hypothetical protein
MTEGDVRKEIQGRDPKSVENRPLGAAQHGPEGGLNVGWRVKGLITHDEKPVDRFASGASSYVEISFSDSG